MKAFLKDVKDRVSRMPTSLSSRVERLGGCHQDRRVLRHRDWIVHGLGHIQGFSKLPRPKKLMMKRLQGGNVWRRLITRTTIRPCDARIFMCFTALSVRSGRLSVIPGSDP